MAFRAASLWAALALTLAASAACADELAIPGLPGVPMPPGARVFGPAAAPVQEKERAAPVQEAQGPKGRQRLLDELFERLAAAGDEAEGNGVALAIQRVWQRSGSDTADVLMTRAMTAVQAKDYPLAQQLLDKIVTYEPDWAEGWNQRATVRFFQQDERGSVADIAHVLALEPRHFGALTGLGTMLQKAGLDARALTVFRRVLALNPNLPGIRKTVEKLTLEVEGQAL